MAGIPRASVCSRRYYQAGATLQIKTRTYPRHPAGRENRSGFALQSSKQTVGAGKAGAGPDRRTKARDRLDAGRAAGVKCRWSRRILIALDIQVQFNPQLTL